MTSEDLYSLHIIGSRGLGGAERFLARLVHALMDKGQRAAVVCRPNSRIQDILDPSIKRFYVAMRNGWDLISLTAIRRLIIQQSPAIVQTYMGRATRLTSVPKKCKSIHVARLGGFYKVRGYYRHADAWVGNTKAICDYLLKSGMDSERVFHIGNFVEPPALTPTQALEEIRGRYSIPSDAVIIFSLGRFVEKKGFQDLLGAFEKVPSEVFGRPVFLVIAGDGPMQPQLEKTSRELGFRDRIRWVGWQNRPEPFYDLADIFVCASREEPLGNVVLEAWAHKLPVIATRTPGPLELITEGQNGFLVPIAEPLALAKAISGLLQEKEVAWQELGAKGFETLNSRHSKEAVVEAYLNMYKRVQQLKH
ncbi:MAG: glycosyltransferase [Deltaproteobacteria bacterium]|nr:glycosyltransferase [Deltaproteobacteria bacterium]MBW2083246.1 glycosyltransferase [Deltaproteobacteria bacterium]